MSIGFMGVVIGIVQSGDYPNNGEWHGKEKRISARSQEASPTDAVDGQNLAEPYIPTLE